MFKINIICQLCIFLTLVILINFFKLSELIVVLLFLLALLACSKNHRFIDALIRFKWFFIIMLFIFAFNTPGEHVSKWPFAFSPTYEGLMAGTTQLLRIVLMLAGLSLILANNTKQQLISGFYFILLPLKFFDIKVERFAARLWLTLHYVEQQDKSKSQNFKSQLENMATLKIDETIEQVDMTLSMPKLNRLDYVLLVMLFSIISLMVCY